MIITIILTMCATVIVCCLAILAKNDFTFNNHMAIIDAICDYQIDCVINGTDEQVDYADVEDYDVTLLRLWDWGYTRILPKDKFDLIKPYIKK